MTSFTMMDETSFSSLADLVAERVLAQMGLYGHRNDSPWLTAKQAAKYLGRPLPTVYELARTGRMPSHRQGGRLSFDRNELDTWVREG